MLDNLERDLRSILDGFAAQGFQTDALMFEPPATEADVAIVEAELGVTFPKSFRDVLTQISRQVDFHWSRPDDHEFPRPFHQNFAGELRWSLDGLLALEAGRQDWVEVCFADVSDDYDRVWHEKLAFQDVGNGDLLSIDLTPENLGNVVYLSHDDGEGHGMVLAPSFEQFLARWVQLACAGGEDWQWLPFMGEGGLEALGDNARAWRDLLKIGRR